jgi:hypothetical protein
MLEAFDLTGSLRDAGERVNAGRTLTPYCRLNLDPLVPFSMATWLSWVLRVVARCGARGCGRSLRPGR